MLCINDNIKWFKRQEKILYILLNLAIS